MSGDLRAETDEELLVELTVAQRRRDALLHDVLLFFLAFTLGAVLYASSVWVRGDAETVWSVSLSDNLILCGLLVAELLVLWNNGVRQGLRGHSIGKHRTGLLVVDARTGRPIGALRGLWRGAVVVVLLDLALAVVPIGLPTALRRLTPDEWHVGGAAYIALFIVVVALLLPVDRGFVDRVARTRVVAADGAGALSLRGRRILLVMDVVGVLGVLTVIVLYLTFFWPLIWQVPSLW